MASGLNRCFRGRYRILCSNTFGDPGIQIANDDSLRYPSAFDGASAQGSLLCSLLAASGDPYRRKRHGSEWPVEEPLELLTALTAGITIPEDPSKACVADWKLKKVGRLPEKLNAALVPGITDLHGVVFVADDLNEDNEWNKAFASQDQQFRQGRTESGKYRIQSVTTVEEALDALLVNNQHLRKWYELTKSQWESRWLPGTADLQSLLKETQKIGKNR